MSAENELDRENPSSGGEGIQLSAMIDKILANPQLISMVASALGPIPRSGGTDSSSRTASSDRSEGTAEQTDGDVSVSATASGAAGGADAADKLPELVAALAPVLSSLKGGGSGHSSTPKGDRRTCLLVALKPYLCRERCEAIDYMIKLGRLSEIFRTLG